MLIISRLKLKKGDKSKYNHNKYFNVSRQTLEFLNSLYIVLSRIARNFLETRENVKNLTLPFYHTNLDWFSWEWSKKNFFEETNSKWPIFQNRRFSKSPILEIFSRKFHRSVLGLVGLIDGKPINIAQPMWSWGCLT